MPNLCTPSDIRENFPNRFLFIIEVDNAIEALLWGENVVLHDIEYNKVSQMQWSSVPTPTSMNKCKCNPHRQRLYSLIEIHNYIKKKIICRCISINIDPGFINTSIKNCEDFGIFYWSPLYVTFTFIICIYVVMQLRKGW